jgi:hypothetical protein
LFTGVNGQAIQIKGSGSSVRRCIGLQCLSSFIENYGSGNIIKNNTGYFNQYGQFDGEDVITGSYLNNIFSENQALDYSGQLLQNNSCVGSISSNALEPYVRNNPLFVNINLDSLDLHLQSQDAGYVYQSAAIGIALDGSDAGAYISTYYPPVVTWFTFTMDYNPDKYKRAQKALKMAEGDTYGGQTYSQAMGGVRMEHDFSWDGTNPMTTNQLISLLNMFNSPTSEVQLSFDGGFTFIPCRLLKSVEPTFTELGGLAYSDDGVPTPIETIKFRESV